MPKRPRSGWDRQPIGSSNLGFGSRIVELTMRQSRKHRALKFIAGAVLLFTLLVVLLPHAQHITVAMACPVLAMVFLFGTINVPLSLWLVSQVSEAHPPQSPDLPFRFQRPPPAIL